MSTATAQLVFDANFIVGLSDNELENLKVELNYGHVILNTGLGTANLDGYIGIVPNPTITGKIYNWTITGLSLNSYYYFDVRVNNVIEKRYYINTADARTFHSLIVTVTDAQWLQNGLPNAELEGATVEVSEDDGATLPRWFDHLQLTGMTDPVTPADLFVFLTTPQANPIFNTITSATGRVLIQGLVNGEWEIEVSKAGKVTRVGVVNFTGNTPTVVARRYSLEDV